MLDLILAVGGMDNQDYTGKLYHRPNPGRWRRDGRPRGDGAQGRRCELDGGELTGTLAGGALRVVGGLPEVCKVAWTCWEDFEGEGMARMGAAACWSCDWQRHARGGWTRARAHGRRRSGEGGDAAGGSSHVGDVTPGYLMVGLADQPREDGPSHLRAHEDLAWSARHDT